MTDGKQLLIYTVIYGEKHLDWWAKAAIPSLMWGSNAKVLEGAKWIVYTDKNTRLGPALESQSVVPMESISIQILNKPDLLWCLRHAIGVCLEENRKLLMAPPDTIFGPDALHPLDVLSSGDLCVAMPHPRVLPAIIPWMEDVSTNSELVSKAMQYAHKSWTESEYGKNPSASFYGGVLWRKVNGKIVLQHRIPTVYMANFTEFDREYFTTRASHFLFWDTYWPHELVNQQRLRLVGSSDLTFMCELTSEHDNVPHLTPPATPPDAYHMKDFDHMKMCRQFFTTFREG